MISKRIAGLLAAGAIALSGATVVAGASNAKLGKIKPGILKLACAYGFSKTQNNHSYTCYRNFVRVCLKGKIKGMPQIVQTGPNTFRVRYTCTNQPH